MVVVHEDRDPQGSVWRRWDPHVHFPGTVLNDQFGGLKLTEALRILGERSPQIQVVGVTDYATTASYRGAEAAWNQGAASNIRLLFPNVELRLDVPTSRSRGVNL